MNSVIRRAQRPKATTSSEYIRYFQELTVELTARADRIGTRLLAGGTLVGSPDRTFPESPLCELDDVCCFTEISEAELQQVLPPLFDSYRRLRRVHSAAACARKFARKSRLAASAAGIKPMLDQYLSAYPERERVMVSNTEETIDGWLNKMLGHCTWSESEHLGHKCQKPLPWSMADMGGGRSTSSLAGATTSTPTTTTSKEN